jgi:hypothetical protein
MQDVAYYLENTIGLDARIERYSGDFKSLPVYIRETYVFYNCWLMDHTLILAEPKSDQEFSIQQIEQQLGLIEKALSTKVILLSYTLTAIERKRLIAKGINFVVPEKQLFLPSLLMDLRESFYTQHKSSKSTLLPSAQMILLFHILYHNQDNITGLSFKGLAEKLQYTQMAISKAIENLLSFGLCEVDDSKKEKMLNFQLPIHDLWQKALPHMVTPVLKTVYVDQRLRQFELHCNLGALAEYTNINFPRQEYYAVERNIYYGLQKQGALENENSKEGAYCLEVWKYEPQILAIGKSYVDPLSLYLSLRNTKDERTQMALEEIINNYTW